MRVQQNLGSDVVMIFDECTPYPASREEARTSMELSLRWAERSRTAFDAGTGQTAAASAALRASLDDDYAVHPWQALAEFYARAADLFTQQLHIFRRVR